MNSKMIFIDIDGTLVVPHQPVSRLNIEAIDVARKNGHKVFLCTGRNRCSLKDVNDVKYDGLVCSAGGFIEIEDEVLFTNYIDFSMLRSIIDLMEEQHIDYCLEASAYTFFSEKMKCRFKNETSEYDVYTMMDGRDASLYKDEGIHKINFIVDTLEDAKHLIEGYQDLFTFVYHDFFNDETVNGEMILKGVDKSTGIQHVLDIFNKDQSCTVGIGDSMNDYEMLQYCAISVAMKGASDTLKACADVIARDVSDDAIYHVFKQLEII